MNNWCICWLFTHIFAWDFNFKELTARRLYQSFGVKGLTAISREESSGGWRYLVSYCEPGSWLSRKPLGDTLKCFICLSIWRALVMVIAANNGRK
jgi:hypothetical protein